MQKFKAGVYTQQNNQYKYESFLPSFINREFEIKDKKINVLLEKASRLLGELNAYSRSIPDLDAYLTMLIRKEANSSSRIEGTQTEIDEIILPEEEIRPEKKDDWHETQNYIKAINFATEYLKELPLCTRLLNNTHKILLESTRGKEKQPGEVRKSQNWIGGSSPGNASYVPPYFEEVPKLLSDLEKFWHNPNIEVPVLIKIAVSHYQFETIHPYSDGNGRIGRLLIILQLVDSRILKKPSFYLSEFFEENKKLYYDSLTIVREKNDIEQWIIFFLQGICQSAEKTIDTLEKIDILRKELELKIMALGRRTKTGSELLKLLYSNVVVNVDFVSTDLNISWSVANNLVADFEQFGILKEITKQKKNRLFVFDSYLKLFK